MATRFDILNLDDLFRSSPFEPTVINDLPYRTDDDREYFAGLIEQRFSDDIISSRPSCRCGHTYGENKVGVICVKCGAEVTRTLEAELRPRLWFRRPGLDTDYPVEKLINPMIWTFLDGRFTKNRFKVLRWLTDRNYRAKAPIPEVVIDLINRGVERGYNYFVRNFWDIVPYLLEHPAFAVKRNKSNPDYPVLDMVNIDNDRKDSLLAVLEFYKGSIFSDYIPLINKSLIILENYRNTLYGEAHVPAIKETVQRLSKGSSGELNRVEYPSSEAA